MMNERGKSDPAVVATTASAMPADQFWQIIERAARSDHDSDAHLEALRVVLRELSREEIISFEVIDRSPEAVRQLASRAPAAS